MSQEAILNTHSNVVTINGESEARDIDGNLIELDKDAIAVEEAKLLAEYEAQEYARNRAAAYDSVGNQLDMLMKDMKNNTTTHQESCEAVKAKFPK